jgi:hypothetical protein
LPENGQKSGGEGHGAPKKRCKTAASSVAQCRVSSQLLRQVEDLDEVTFRGVITLIELEVCEVQAYSGGLPALRAAEFFKSRSTLCELK